MKTNVAGVTHRRIGPKARLGIVAIGTALACGLGGPSTAVGQTPSEYATVAMSGGTLVITGTEGVDHLWLTEDGQPYPDRVRVSEHRGKSLLPGPGCDWVYEYVFSAVECPIPTAVNVSLFSGNDEFITVPDRWEPVLTMPMTISGGPGDDTIESGVGNDTIHGGDGHDTIRGDAGNDLITGGNGNDTIHGFEGNDTIHGGDGNDLVYGGAGTDVLNGDAGDDHVYGGDGNDTIHGGTGDDRLGGDDGDDIVDGGAGNDQITGGCDTDTLIGGPGADTFYSDQGPSSVCGRSGRSPFDRIEAADGEQDSLFFCQETGDTPGDIAVVDIFDPVRRYGSGACATIIVKPDPEADAPPDGPPADAPPDSPPVVTRPATNPQSVRPAGTVRLRIGTTVQLLVGTGRRRAAAKPTVNLRTKRVTLGTYWATKRTRVTATATVRQGRRTVVIGRATTTVPVRNARPVTLRLTAPGQRALRKLKRARVTAAFKVGKKTYRRTYVVPVARR